MAGFLFTAFAAAAAMSANYQINLEVARVDGEVTHTTAFETQAVIRDGSISLSRGPDGADPLMQGEFTIDETKGEVFAELTICMPEADPCKALATPSLLFKLGELASMKVNGDEVSYSLSFNPIAE